MFINSVERLEEKLRFQILFLKDDEDQTVEVMEVEEIDMEEVKRRVEGGESVFITPKRKRELKPTLTAVVEAAEPLYFYHI